jgi:hypothetical protein
MTAAALIVCGWIDFRDSSTLNLPRTCPEPARGGSLIYLIIFMSLEVNPPNPPELDKGIQRQVGQEDPAGHGAVHRLGAARRATPEYSKETGEVRGVRPILATIFIA